MQTVAPTPTSNYAISLPTLPWEGRSIDVPFSLIKVTTVERSYLKSSNISSFATSCSLYIFEFLVSTPHTSGTCFKPSCTVHRSTIGFGAPFGSWPGCILGCLPQEICSFVSLSVHHQQSNYVCYFDENSTLDCYYLCRKIGHNSKHTRGSPSDSIEVLNDSRANMTEHACLTL